MGGIFSAVINQGNVAGIQVQSVQPAVVDGLAYQIFFQAGGEYASIGDGKVWRNLKGSADTYSFFNGLEQSGTNVFNTLVTGLGSAQEINGFNDDIGGAGLRFKAATESLINDNQIEFYGNGSTSTFFHQNNGNWDFGSRLKLNATSGSHIQSLWQSAAPSGNASQSHFWFDSIGSPSFRIATGNWWKFTPNTLTSNRSYGLQDSNYTIAGIDISQTFTAAQTFQAGATFGAALNAIAGSAATPSINFGTSNTGIFGDSTTVRISVAGTQRMQINNGGNMTVTGNISALQLQTSNGTFLSSPSVPLTNGAGANTGTLTNAPQGGNPTKWIPINDNGNTRYIPCW